MKLAEIFEIIAVSGVIFFLFGWYSRPYLSQKLRQWKHFFFAPRYLRRVKLSRKTALTPKAATIQEAKGHHAKQHHG